MVSRNHESLGAPLIVLRDVTKRYRMGEVDVEALRGVSLCIRQGEWVAVMGPSGSGKSTLMNIIGCLDTPTTGLYYLEGSDVSSLSDDALADVRGKRIGFVFQTFNLLPRATALEQVMLPLQYRRPSPGGRQERTRLAHAALDQVGLGEWARHHPGQLSGGQRQRVAMARALVSDPALLLADEPTGNLDTNTGREILALIKDLHVRLNTTIVIVTHDPQVAASCDRTVTIRDGKVVTDQYMG
jgi:putative ABC transport system ATP-binding protein